jgi:hypothetical protein
VSDRRPLGRTGFPGALQVKIALPHDRKEYVALAEQGELGLVNLAFSHGSAENTFAARYDLLVHLRQGLNSPFPANLFPGEI